MEDNSKKVARPVAEVPEKATRRQFSAGFKLRILEQADRCTERGQLGELLRREGLYSSQLSAWRKQRADGALSRLQTRKRGRKPKRNDPKDLELAELRRENQKLQDRLRQAETIIEVQKKVSEILGVTLPLSNDERS